MASWHVQNAEAHFNELLEQAEQDGPQIITSQGAERAVVLSIDSYRSLTATVAHPGNANEAAYSDFRDWLLNGPKLEDDDPFFAALKRDPNDAGRDVDL